MEYTLFAPELHNNKQAAGILDIRPEIKLDVTANDKNETFAVCFQLFRQKSDNTCVCVEKQERFSVFV